MKYKTLLVSGCSFTENQGTWGFQLAPTYNLDLINLACKGAGNQHIAWSVISFLEKNNIDPETTLIGIMWSHPYRTDLVFERNPEYKDQSIFKYNYDSYNSLVRQSDLLEKHEFSQNRAVQASYLQINGNRLASTFKTWSLKTMMTAYLKDKKFTFFQTAFLNYLTQSSVVKGIPYLQHQLRYQYLQDLENLGLNHNLHNWLNLQETEYLGEYAFHKRQMSSDGYHPSEEGYKSWTEKILIPNLEKMKIL